ncbi:amidohydrolase family protein [candidate division KSB1 bacterium]|nr:amidohydrolase family protein [candidate division KSB1 bacterium]
MFHTRSVFKAGDVIDIHVHLGGPHGENDALYYWSDKFTHSLSYEGIKLVTRLNHQSVTGLRYLSVLYHQIKKSKRIHKLVLLGLDETYSEAGQKQPHHSHLYVSNEYIAHLSHLYPEFLFGCSVHPYSPTASFRLWEAAQAGAVLCKWLPSSQAIDPTHPLSVKFYRALARLNLPLLLHVGPEAAIPSGGISLADERLFNAGAGHFGTTPGDGIEMALDAGVKVIVAHAATPVGPLFDPDNAHWEAIFDQLLRRAQGLSATTRLYADISAFCLPGRMRYIRKIMPFINEMPARFCYGSDFPIPIISFNQGSRLQNILAAFGWLAGRALPRNDFDKNYQLLEPHFPPAIFTNATQILRQPQQAIQTLTDYFYQLGESPPGTRHFSFGNWWRTHWPVRRAKKSANDAHSK